MAKQRNTYNNDRLMWLGAFAPALRKPRPAIQATEQLAKPTDYPSQSGPLSITMRIAAASLMAEDDKVKVFVNGTRVLKDPISGWTDLPLVEANDLVSVWVYSPSDFLPAQAKAVISFVPQITGSAPSFPAPINAVMYGYVNGLETTATNISGSPVNFGDPPLTNIVQLEMETVKELNFSEEEIAQLVFTATPASGRPTEFACRLQVVMCEKLERFQAVQHDGSAGGPFLSDLFTGDSIYLAGFPSYLDPFNIGFVRAMMYSRFDGNNQLIASAPSYSTSSTVGPAITVAEQQIFAGTLNNMPTGTYKGREAYSAALNIALGSLPAGTLIASGQYTSPSSPPGSILAIPSHDIEVTLEAPLKFIPEWKISTLQNLPVPDGYDPEETSYQEVIVSSDPTVSASYTRVLTAGGLYSWPPFLVSQPPFTGGFSGPAITDATNYSSSNVPPKPILGTAFPLLLAPTYVLNQYVDAENPELSPQPGRAVYIQLTSTVELSDAQYAALREAGVQSISDLEAFIVDNPDVGEIATTTEFDLDLNTPQMQDVLGTNQEDQDKADALFALLNDGFTPSEDFLAAAGNSVQSKLYPPSPSNMDKLKMAGKVVSGVNSLVTLGKIIANIGVLQTPLGILMLINTGINIYNATQAAQGLANNQNPQYIPTINESIYNSLFRDPNPPRSNLPRTVPPFPRRIP